MVNIFPAPDTSVETPMKLDQYSLFDYSNKVMPNIITGAILQLLRYHFSDAHNIETASLKNVLWTNNKDSSILTITTGTSKDISKAAIKPAIFVNRGPCEVKPLGLSNSGIYANVDSSGRTCAQSYCSILLGKHTIICESYDAPTFAETLANEVFSRMLLFGPMIANDLQLKTCTVTALGEVQKNPNTAVASYIVPITMSWGKSMTWGNSTNEDNYLKRG